MKKIMFTAIFFVLFVPALLAANRNVDLTIGYKTVNFTGQPAKAVVLNDQLPGPVLHFKEGDHVSIHVYNHLDKGTAIHWHGILLPWQMDGVAHVTQEPIPPGGVFHYHYTLKQSGTYWYHAHADLQEQQGVYGAFIVDPIKKPPYRYTKDYPVVLSDWSDTDPDQIYSNLKNEGDYYNSKFPLQPSLAHFIRSYKQATPADRKELVDAYSMMQTMRMSPYDLSDVAYDTFLLNGHSKVTPWIQQVHVGDVVRLRFVDAGGSTIFHVKIPDTKMQVVHIQGNDVEPYDVDDLTLAPGETYDVLVKIQKDRPYIIYAESNDTLGKVYGALVTHSDQTVPFSAVPPFAEPKPIMMMNHGGHAMAMMDMASHSNETKHSEMIMQTHHDMSSSQMEHSKGSTMDMSHHHDMMGAEPMKIDKPPMAMSAHSMEHSGMSGMTAAKYRQVVALTKTNNPNKPVTIINMSLSGWMGRYVWFLNGVPEYQAHPILIEPGKRYRIVFKNETMMRHPMHLHGHWLILRNGHGVRDPKIHTIDIQPNETVVADFDADAKSGFWYFHCHNLFHMRAGMAKLVRYQGTSAPDFMTHHTTDATSKSHQADEDYNMRHLTAHPARWYRANELEVGANPFDNYYQLTYKGLFGPDFNKLQLYTEDAEINRGTVEDADVDIFYWHLIDQFWAVKGGMNYFNRPSQKPYWQPGVGIEGLMPYFIDTNIRVYYHSGSAKFDIQLARDSQILDNFFIRLGVRSILATKSVAQDDIGSGLNQMRYIVMPYYRLMPGVNLFAEYEHQQYHGVTKDIVSHHGESAVSNTTTLGLAFIF